jgi:ubiquinone/menaquinone biosynthesis C-methylase UbiE
MADAARIAMLTERFEKARFSPYARQEFMTPGVPEVLDLLALSCRPDRALILEVASGKGEAACRLAERHEARVVGIDLMAMFARPAAAKAAARRVSHKVSFSLGDGGQLPVREAIFDIALCTGSPKIAGGDACLREMHRALKPGGWLVVSDLIWLEKEAPPDVVPPGWAGAGIIMASEYAALLGNAGFEDVRAIVLPSYVWNEYYGPMLEHYAEVKRLHPDDDDAQRWANESYANEPRFWYETDARDYWAYAAFLGRKR